MDNIKAYGDTSLGDIIKEAHERSRDQKERLDDLVEDLSGMIENAQDANVIVPLLKDYLKIEVDNNELLVKIARVVQRAAAAQDEVDEDDGNDSGLSSGHKQELRNIAQQLGDTSDSATLVKDAENFIKDSKN